MASYPTLTLRPGHVRPVWAGHPWVYAQAIGHVEGSPQAGDEVVVCDPQGQFLGRGFYSPRSALPVRLSIREPDQVWDLSWVRSRLTQAKRLRAALGLPNAHTNGYRLVHGEGDNLPGLVIDIFHDTAVVQITTLGLKQRQAVWLQALLETIELTRVLDRTPVETARREGFAVSSAPLHGAPLESLEFSENGFNYSLPVTLAQKTGFYFDQRPFRTRIAELSCGKNVLDAFCFVGSFALAAARGGASHVVGLDKNETALHTAERLAQRHGLADKITYTKEDVRRTLQDPASVQAYDVVICDPPKLAPTQGAKKNALRAYEHLAELACQAVRHEGLLAFCSCSAGVSLDVLTRALGVGARKSGVRATVLERHFQGPDHPVAACFPEGLYLKSLLVRIERDAL